MIMWNKSQWEIWRIRTPGNSNSTKGLQWSTSPARGIDPLTKMHFLIPAHGTSHERNWKPMSMSIHWCCGNDMQHSDWGKETRFYNLISFARVIQKHWIIECVITVILEKGGMLFFISLLEVAQRRILIQYTSYRAGTQLWNWKSWPHLQLRH